MSRVIHGYNNSGTVQEDLHVWPWGTRAQPKGQRIIRFEGPDRDAAMNSVDDDILGRWNQSNHSYPPGHPCAPAVGGQVAGPWPGIWLDHAAEKMGKESEQFFAAYKSAGGELDEIVLDSELGWLGFDTWEIADNWANPDAPTPPSSRVSDERQQFLQATGTDHRRFPLQARSNTPGCSTQWGRAC